MTAPASGPGGVLGRRSFLVGSALTLTSAASFALVPRRAEEQAKIEKLDRLIPLQIGPWRFATTSGVVVPSVEGPVDSYDQVLTRVYDAPGLPSIMLLIAYGSTQGGSLQLHRPETCYPGQGFKLSDMAPMSLSSGVAESVSARKFTATRDDRVERLAYWTRIADKFPLNTAGEYAAIIGSVLRGTVPDGVLVRISSIGPDVVRSDRAIATFATALIDGPAAAGKLLVGKAMAAAIQQKASARRR